ncbi:MAG: hypothetical protein J6V53_04140 [Alphaproteobacteria bacterium]|nr:hypothetical protein [Alphaproteobacteria bacterium]
MSAVFKKRMVNRSINRLIDFVYPAPVGGLNSTASFDAMNLNEAIAMDNYIPFANHVSLRKGYVPYAKLKAPVKTLATFKSVKGVERLLAFSGGEAFDVSTPKDCLTLSEEELLKQQGLMNKGFLSDDWQFALFKNRLYLTNGVDPVQVYEEDETGASYGSINPAEFTSGQEEVTLNLSKMDNVFVAKQRLWFIEKGSMKVWYSENAGEVKGKLLSFDMSAVSSFAGTLVAGATWTQDGGAGMDDLIVFITSEGEVLVYKGNNPNDANDWSLKGVYKMAAPLGKKCFIKYFGDLVLISKEGYVPLSKALPLEGANASQLAFSNKIQELVTERAKYYGAKKGWQGVLYPRGGWALFNVPTATGFEQHVCNTMSGAWCRFVDIKSYCWDVFADRLYFGSDCYVYLFDEGYTDDKKPIHGKIQQAFSNLGTARYKRVTLLNPCVKSSRPFALKIYTNTDFDTSLKPYQTTIGEAGDSRWNELKWSTLKPVSSMQGTSNAKWARLAGIHRSNWISNLASGVYFSLVLETKTKGVSIDFFSTSVRWE